MAKLRLPFSLDNPDELTPAVYADAVYDETLQKSQAEINAQINSLDTIHEKLDYIILLLENTSSCNKSTPTIDPDDSETIIFNSCCSLDPEEDESMLLS